MLVAPVAAVLLAFAAPVPGAADPVDDHEVGMRSAAADERAVAAPTVDELEGGDVLTVRVTGGVPTARGQVRQCRLNVGGFTGCTNQFPVQFGADGDATFQYQLVDIGRCGATGACVVVVGDRGGERIAYAFSVFGGPAPAPPAVTLSPPGPYEPGDAVRVEVSSLAAGTPIDVAFCAPACGVRTRSVAGADGTATASVVVGDRCRNCGILVVGGASSTLEAVPFTPPPSPDYDVGRLAAGLVAAAGLLVLAWRVVSAVDWTPPSEASTPELELDDT